MLHEALILAAVGIAIGLPTALGTSKFAESFRTVEERPFQGRVSGVESVGL